LNCAIELGCAAQPVADAVGQHAETPPRKRIREGFTEETRRRRTVRLEPRRGCVIGDHVRRSERERENYEKSQHEHRTSGNAHRNSSCVIKPTSTNDMTSLQTGVWSTACTDVDA